MNPSEGFVTAGDGVRLFCQKAGTGAQAVVVLNGFYLSGEFERLTEDHTMIFLDLRNRGRSDYLTDELQLSRGVHQDVDDIEVVRRYFALDRVALIGHSYAGAIVILYAMKYPAHVSRIVQLSAMQPSLSKPYPEHLRETDAVLEEFLRKAAALKQTRELLNPFDLCKEFWSLLRRLYVVDPANMHKINWDRCDLPAELNFMKYWMQYILPSLQTLQFKPKDLRCITAPVLTVHGRQDRSAPYGGALDWVSMLPNARLLTVEKAAHAPWLENPQTLDSIATFLAGIWPATALGRGPT
jgi:proline iminopeptidase